jgi:hypothetical protein
VVGGLLLVAVAVVVFVSTRPAATWDSRTPEATVQAFLAAVQDARADDAGRLLDSQGRCDVDDLDQAAMPDLARVDLVESVVDGDSARVVVQVVFSTGGPLDSPATEKHAYRLSRSGDGWLLVGTPWPLYSCGGGVSK